MVNGAQYIHCIPINCNRIELVIDFHVRSLLLSTPFDSIHSVFLMPVECKMCTNCAAQVIIVCHRLISKQIQITAFTNYTLTYLYDWFGFVCINIFGCVLVFKLKPNPILRSHNSRAIPFLLSAIDSYAKKTSTHYAKYSADIKKHWFGIAMHMKCMDLHSYFLAMPHELCHMFGVDVPKLQAHYYTLRAKMKMNQPHNIRKTTGS